MSKPRRPAPMESGTTDRLIRVRFAREHTHAGVDYAAGDEIEVPQGTVDLLRLYQAID